MRVLLAEDEKTTRLRLESYLKRWGYDVVAVDNGQNAWELFDNEEFHMVITDWEMPEVDGIELIKRIRESFNSSYVYILLLTSRTEKQDVVEGMEKGADDFLSKPFDRNELRVRVRAGERIIELEQSLARRNEELETAIGSLETANYKMKQDLDAAAEIQKTFLPAAIPEFPGIAVSWVFEPCDELAGDTLNIVPLDDENIAMYVVDVSGHGVQAALLSVGLSRMLSVNDPSSVLKEASDEPPGYRIVPPAEVATRLNERFESDETEQYFTMIYGILNLKSRKLCFVCAGHPGPIHMRKTAGPEFIEASGLPIGLVPALDGESFEQHTLDLSSGDRVLFYSDGVPETANSSDVLFDTEGILDILSLHHDSNVGPAIEVLLTKLAAWRGNSPVTDDISVLGVQVD